MLGGKRSGGRWETEAGFDTYQIIEDCMLEINKYEVFTLRELVEAT